MKGKHYGYALRTCNADMTAHGGFKWKKRGKMVCPDWNPTKKCGNGFHAALWGEGDGSLFCWDSDAVWQVLRIDSKPIDLGGKIKFGECYVIYSGDKKTACEMIIKLGAKGAVIGGTATAGYAGTATAGYAGTATAGDAGTATAGDAGTATAGYAGTATAGDAGTATAGYAGTATAGDDGTATAGNRGTATAGNRGSIVIKMWDTKKQKYVLRVAEVGENGIKPNVAYKLNNEGEFIEVTPK